MYEPLIKVRDFSFSIGNKNILKKISFSVRKGELLSIIGPNGAGKTTLLKCFVRILTGGEGKISIRGMPVDSYSQKEWAKLIGYVPQSNGRAFPFTVREFVLMGRYPHLSPFSMVSNEDKNVVNKVLELTGTTQFAERRMGTLSGGERQKVFIAGALAQGSDILMLDEPTSFLDYRHQSEVLELLRSINEESRVTILLVTHDINSATITSERILALKNGSLVFSGTPEETMRNEVLEEIFEKSFRFVDHPLTGIPMIVP